MSGISEHFSENMVLNINYQQYSTNNLLSDDGDIFVRSVGPKVYREGIEESKLPSIIKDLAGVKQDGPAQSIVEDLIFFQYFPTKNNSLANLRGSMDAAR